MAMTIEDIRRYREQRTGGRPRSQNGAEAVRQARQRKQREPAESAYNERQRRAEAQIRQQRKLEESFPAAASAQKEGDPAVKQQKPPPAASAPALVAKSLDKSRINRQAVSAAKQYGVAYTGDTAEELRTAARQAYADGKRGQSKRLFERAEEVESGGNTAFPAFSDSSLKVDTIPQTSGRLHEEWNAGDYLRAAGNAAAGTISSLSTSIVNTVKAVDDLASMGLEAITGQPAGHGLQPLYDYFQSLDEDAQARVAEDIRTGKMNGTAYNLLSGLVQQIPTIAIGLLTGGTSAAGQAAGAVSSNSSALAAGIKQLPELFKNPQFLWSFLQSFGGTYGDAVENGANPAQAFLAGVVDALPESAIEVGGGLESAMAEGPATSWKDFAKRWIRSAAEEAGEEIRQDPFSGLAQMTYDPDMKIFSLTDPDAVLNPVRAAESAAAAFLTTLISGGIGTGVRSYQAIQDAGRQVIDSGNTNTLLSAALDSADGTIRSRAVQLIQRQMEGKEPSVTDLGRLAWDAANAQNASRIGLEPEKPPKQVENRTASMGVRQNETAAAAEPEAVKLKPPPVKTAKPQADGAAGEPVSVSMAERLGESGKRAYQYTLEHSGIEEDGMRPAFLAYYHYGLAGSDIKNVPSEFGMVLDPESAQRAWYAGQNDRAAGLNQTSGKAVSGKGGLVQSRAARTVDSRTRAAVDAAARLAGVQVVFDGNLSESTNGYFDGQAVHLNPKSQRPLLSVLNHEVTHHIQEASPELYRQYRDYVISYLTKKDMAVLDELVQKQIRAYDGQGRSITYEQALDEVASDASDQFLRDESAVRRLARENRSLGQKVLDAIRDVIGKIKAALKGEEVSADAARILQEDLKAFEEAEDLWIRALASARDGENSVDIGEKSGYPKGTKFSLNGGKEDGTVRGDQTESKGVGTSGGTSAQTDQTADTGRSGQNRQRMGGELRSEVGSTIRREDFLREHRELGERSVRLKSGHLYAYHEATEAELNSNARKAASILSELGIPYFTTTDGIHIYANGKTRTSSQAVTIHDGADVKIAVSANMETEGVTTAYHEAFHFLRDIAPALRVKLQGTIRESIVENKSYETFSSRIAGAYQIPLDPSQRTKAQEAKFQEELNAYICGEVMAQNPDSKAWRLICEFISDTDAVYSAAVDMYTAFKEQQKGRDGRHLDPNKKRTDSWLEARRLQLPVGLTNYDSIASVTYTDRNVKGELSFGDHSGKTAMQLALEKALGTGSSDTSISEKDENDTGKERYSFAGAEALTADQSQAKKAVQMEKEGAEAETIRQETGWFRGSDGNWRFEIDDSKAKIHLEKVKLNGYTRLGDILEHDSLYAAYPQLKEIRVRIADSVFMRGKNAVFDLQQNDINLNELLLDDPEAMKKVLLHEAEHGIQMLEGFANGSSVSRWEQELAKGTRPQTRRIREAEAVLRELSGRHGAEFAEDMAIYAELDGKEAEGYAEKLEKRYGKDWWDAARAARILRLSRETPESRTAEELYWDTAGEIEARDTAARSGLDTEARRRVKPDTGNPDTVFSDIGSRVFSIEKDSSGRDTVVIEQDIFEGREGSRSQIVRDYLREHIGEVYTLIESGQKVYLGKDLPGEYVHSKYSKRLKGTTESDAKDQAAQGLGEMIEIATNRRWEKPRHSEKHARDAKYGFYKYETRFAIPGKAGGGHNIYLASLVIRNDANGKKYLYDVIGIKKDSNLSLTQKKVSGQPATGQKTGAGMESAAVLDSGVLKASAPKRASQPPAEAGGHTTVLNSGTEASAPKGASQTPAQKGGVTAVSNQSIPQPGEIFKGDEKFSLAGTGIEGQTYSLNIYSPQQKKNWLNSKRITIYENREQFDQFVKDSLAGKEQGKLYFGMIPADVAARIEAISGLQVAGYNLAINAYEIRKILLHSHGNEKTEGLRGQRKITKDDLLLIPEIISSPDRIELDNRPYEGKPVLRFSKNVGPRTVVVTYVTRKHHDLSVQTMYGGKKEESLSTATDVHAPVLTSETSRGTAFINQSIPQPGEIFKGDEKFSLAGTETASERIRENQRRVAEMAPVADLKGDEFRLGTRTLTQEISAFFETLGNQAESPEIGTVMLTRRGVKDSFSHGIGPEKASAFAAVPAVIEQGKVIDYERNWKGRGYDTIVLAAPVTIGQQRYLEAVIVKRLYDGQRFYVHEVEMEKDTSVRQTGPVISDAAPGAQKYPSVTSLLQKIQKIKDGGKFSLAGTETAEKRNLLQENERLRKAVEALKGEFQLTKGVKFSDKAVDRLAGTILRAYSSKYDRKELLERLKRIFTYMEMDPDPNSFEKAYGAMAELSKAVLNESESIDRTLWDETKELRDRIRTTAVFVPEEDRGGFPEGFEAFRRENFGRLRLSRDGVPLDAFYQELSEEYPGYFPADVTAALDRLENLAGFSDAVRPRIENPYGMDLEEQAAEAAGRMFDAYFDIPQVKTFADKKREEMLQLKGKHRIEMEKFRAEAKERQKRAEEAARERLKNLRDQKNARVAEAIEAERQKAREAREKLRDSRAVRKYRERIARTALDLNRRLLNPTDKKHIPEELRQPVAAFLSSLDFSGEKQDTKTAEIWRDLQRKWADIAAGQSREDFSGEYLTIDPDLAPRLDELIQSGAPERLHDLNRAEMEELWKVTAAVKAAVTEADRKITEEKQMTAEEAGNRILADLQDRKPAKEKRGAASQWAADFFRYDMTDSIRFAEMFGPAMEELMQHLRSGHDVMVNRWNEAVAYTGELFGGRKVWKWGNGYAEPQSFPLKSGETIQLTPAQVMSLYLLNKREQARRHIYQGGIESGETVWKSRKRRKGSVKAVTESDVKKILESLTPEQREIADGLGQFLSGRAAEWGNEASMERFGYRKFTEKNYFPIRPDSDYTVSRADGMAREGTIAGLGMTKSTNKAANNPLVVEDVFETFSRHVTEMAAYNAFYNRLEDFQAVWNWRAKGFQSVKASLRQAGGEEANQYIRKLLTAVNGRASVERSAAESLLGKYKAGVIGGNLRVVVQQPTAYVRALTVMDGKYLLKGLAGKVDPELMKTYSPIARWKDWGYFETGNGKQLNELVLGRHRGADRFSDAAMWLPGQMDNLTWGRIWKACEYEIADTTQLEAGSEEFYQAVGKRFTEVIDKTQVVDSVFHRSQVMRSKNAMNQVVTAFMAEPTKAYNAVMGAVRRMQEARDAGEKKAAEKGVFRAVSAFVLTGVVNALTVSLMDAARDDDDGEGFAEKYRQALLGDSDPGAGVWKKIQAGLSANLTENLNPLGLLPYAKDVLSLLEGFDVKRMDMQGAADLVASLGKWMKLGDSRYTAAYLVKDTAESLSKLTGVPIGNLMRELGSLINLTLMAADSFGADTTEIRYFLNRSILDSKNSLNLGIFAGLILDARQAGNEELALEIYNDLVKNGWSNDKIDARLETLAKKQLEGAELVENYLDAEETGGAAGMESALDAAKEEGFSADEFLAAVNQERNRRGKEEKEAEAGEEINSEYWSGGTDIYNYDTLYQAVLNGDAESETAIREALERSGKKPENIQNAVESRIREDLKEAFWESGSLEDVKVKRFRALLLKQDGDTDVDGYLEKAVWKMFQEKFKGGSGEYSEYRKYYDILKNVFGYTNDYIIREGKAG